MLRASRLWELYSAHFIVTLTRYLAYRLELCIWLLSMILQPVIFLAVWQSSASQRGGTIGGFSTADFATYFIFVMLINHATMAWVMFEWESRIKRGDLSYLLLRPHHVIHRDIAENITFKTATVPVMLLTALGLTFTFHPAFHFQWWSVLAFIPTILMAYALRFSLDWITGIGCFYTTRVDAINVLYFFMVLLFSGQMAPFPLLPKAVQVAASFLPFRWCIDFPVRLLMGRLTPQETVFGLCAQAAWIIVVIVLGRLAWNRAVREYQAVGL